MIKLDIIGVDGYSYMLEDINGKKYKLNIEFYDIDFKIGIGDILYISEDIINNNETLRFGSIDSEYGRRVESELDKDLIVIVNNDKKYYLKRLYG